MRNLNEINKQKHGANKFVLVEPPIKPIYDEIYVEGVAWLDSLAESEQHKTLLLKAVLMILF